MTPFDERLDSRAFTVSFDGQTLTEGTDYTVAVDGQKVTVNIKDHLLTKANGGKKFVITYKTVTNSKVETDGSNIDNELTQVVDGNVAHSNKVTTELLYEKTHEFISGTPNRELPQEVLDLLPGKQTRIPNGTTVTPDQPLGGVTRVETPDGTWVFIGYDHDSEVIDHKNAHFIGVWVVLPQPKKDVLDGQGNSIDGNKVTGWSGAHLLRNIHQHHQHRSRCNHHRCHPRAHAYVDAPLITAAPTTQLRAP